MKIGGLQPCTLSDYPGRIAAIVFLQGCNFRCPFCHNGSLLPTTRPSGELIPEEVVLSRLAARREKLEGVVITGGEPTLQTDLGRFLGAIKQLGFAVKLDTNGSRPAVVRDLIDAGLVDYLAMDLNAPLDSYPRLTGLPVDTAAITESIQLIAHSGLPHEFRTTVVEPLLTPEEVDAIKALVPPGSHHRLQTFRPENALDPDLRQA